MRRADRLFRIVQRLRHGRLVTGRELAEEMEVSLRTIYRDIQDLSLSGVPVLGEAGAGYRLLNGFDLPPLMFDSEELSALLLGMRMVCTWGGSDLSGAARRAMDKIESAVPERLRPELARTDLMAPGLPLAPQVGEHLGRLRGAIRDRGLVKLDYRRADGGESRRRIEPLGLAFWGKVWTLVAWCRLRGDFRHFRLDRIRGLQLTGERFEPGPGRRLEDFLRRVEAQEIQG